MTKIVSDPRLDAILAQQPVDHLVIGGRRHPLGQLTAEDIAEVRERGERLVAGTLKLPDIDPFKDLRTLLLAGDTAFDWTAARPYISREHVLLAAQETLRQAAIAAVDPAAAAGRA